MCGPAAAIAVPLLIGVASTGLAYYSEEQQAKSNNRFQARAAKEAQDLAKQSFDFQTQQEQLKQQEVTQAANQQVQQVRKEAAQARSTARVSAGESGVAGLSVDALLADFDTQEADSIGAIQRNRMFEFRQSRANLRGRRANSMNQLASSRFAPVRGPSALGAGLQVAGSGLDAYTSYRT